MGGRKRKEKDAPERQKGRKWGQPRTGGQNRGFQKRGTGGVGPPGPWSWIPTKCAGGVQRGLALIPRHTCRTVSPLDAPSSPPLWLLVSCIYTLVRVHCAYSSVVVCDCCSCFWCVDLFPVFPRSLKVFLPLFYFVFLWEFAIRVPLELATLVTSSDPAQRQFVTSGFMLDLSETVIPASFGTFISPLILVLVMAVASVDWRGFFTVVLVLRFLSQKRWLFLICGFMDKISSC